MMDKEQKLNKIIELLDTHIRGAGDVAGVMGRTKEYMEKFIFPRINSEAKVLDVGAGDGCSYEYLKDKVNSWTGINKGVDQVVNGQKYNTIEMDFHNMSFDSNSFDLVMSVNTLEHAYFPMLMMYEINRVSKDLIYIQMPMPQLISGLHYDSHPDHYFICSDVSWENMFSKLGWEIVDKGIAGGEYQWLLKKTKDWY